MLLILALLLATALPSSQAAAAHLNLLKDPRARCLDGTPGGYYIEPSATNPTRFVIHLQGGGECDTLASCSAAARSYLGSSKYFSPTMNLGFLNSDNCTANPDFCSWTHVHVAYCSQDLHGGQRLAPAPETFNFLFAGAYIVRAILDELDARYGLTKATDIILSGDSAGGIGTWLHVDALARRYAGSTVVSVPIAGFYFYAYPYEGPNHTSSVLVDFSPANWPRLVTLWNATMDASCVRALASTPWACMLANYSAPYVSSSVFVVESQTDQVVLLDHDNIPQKYITQPEELAYVRSWSLNMTSALSLLPLMPGHGVFSPACFIHTDFSSQSPLIDSLNYYQVIGRWYYRRPGATVVVDNCGVFCNPTCAKP